MTASKNLSLREQAAREYERRYPRRNSYGADIIRGYRRVSGADLQGGARAWSLYYKKIRLDALGIVAEFGGRIIEEGRGRKHVLQFPDEAPIVGLIGRKGLRKFLSSKKNPPSEESYLQVGKLSELELANGQIIHPKRTLLIAWKNNARKSGNLFFCLPIGRKGGKLNPAVIKQHRDFHGAEPTGSILADCPDPAGELREIGLIKAISYVSSNIQSPAKVGAEWRHIFGDTGHKGENQPTSKMPKLMTDGSFLFIRRRKGNGYYIGIYKNEYAYIIG